ncbi:hypothetical protein LINPERPRIM_LOCUS29368 [Linum perenne]
MLLTCPSAYDKRCLLQLLAATEFGDGGSATTYYRQLYWKINLAGLSLCKDDDVNLGNESLDDALAKNGYWEQARNWARQLGASGGTWKPAVHHVNKTQSFLAFGSVNSRLNQWWLSGRSFFVGSLSNSVPQIFIPSFAGNAGLVFLKHAEAVEKDLPAKELLLSLQWLSGMIILSDPLYPLHLLREIEARVWLLAVESEAEIYSGGESRVLGLSFSEEFDKKPVEVLHLLSLKAQKSFEEALLLVQTHTMAASSITILSQGLSLVYREWLLRNWPVFVIETTGSARETKSVTLCLIVLDQPFLLGVHVLWEYCASHNDWDEILKLFDIIPSSVLTNGSPFKLPWTVSSQQTPTVGYGSEFQTIATTYASFKS